jgi:hypothetical protein
VGENVAGTIGAVDVRSPVEIDTIHQRVREPDSKANRQSKDEPASQPDSERARDPERNAYK